MTRSKQNRAPKHFKAKGVLNDKVLETLEADCQQIVIQNHGHTDAEYQEALARISAGVSMDRVTKDMGLTRTALFVRAHNDPEGFGKMLKTALGISAFTQLEHAESALWGGDMSTGDVARDKAIAEHMRWKSSRLMRDLFGDKALIEASSFTVVVRNDSDDSV